MKRNFLREVKKFRLLDDSLRGTVDFLCTVTDSVLPYLLPLSQGQKGLSLEHLKGKVKLFLIL